MDADDQAMLDDQTSRLTSMNLGNNLSFRGL